MRRLTIMTILMFALAGCAASDETTTASFESGVNAAEPVSEPPPAPEPDGTYSLNCDMLLGDFTENPETGYRFVAGGKVKNTGNIGTVVEVEAEWEVLGSEPVVETRRVRLPIGQTRNVDITVPATDDQIDAHQSADSRCQIDGTMIDTFGRAR